MTTIFDFLSTALFIAAAGLFFLRFRHEDPPLAPYVAISLACAAANWLGNEDVRVVAAALLLAGALFVVHLARRPYKDDARG